MARKSMGVAEQGQFQGSAWTAGAQICHNPAKEVQNMRVPTELDHLEA